MSKKSLPDFVIDPSQFGNTADWLLYTPNEYIRAKQLAEDSNVEGKAHKEGDYVVVTRDGEVSVVAKDDFEARYEVVKGPHKREY